MEEERRGCRKKEKEKRELRGAQRGRKTGKEEGGKVSERAGKGREVMEREGGAIEESRRKGEWAGILKRKERC